MDISNEPEGEEFFAADPEKIMRRAVNDARFAKNGFETGHGKKGLLLTIRGLEKILMYHCMTRNIPFSRDERRLSHLYNALRNTDLYGDEKAELCRILDMFQNEQEEEIMDIINSSDSCYFFSASDEEEQETGDAPEFQFNLEDWEKGEWTSEGWSKNSTEKPEQEEDASGPDESSGQEKETEEVNEQTESDTSRPVQVTETLFKRAQAFFHFLVHKTE